MCQCIVSVTAKNTQVCCMWKKDPSNGRRLECGWKKLMRQTEKVNAHNIFSKPDPESEYAKQRMLYVRYKIA